MIIVTAPCVCILSFRHQPHNPKVLMKPRDLEEEKIKPPGDLEEVVVQKWRERYFVRKFWLNKEKPLSNSCQLKMEHLAGGGLRWSWFDNKLLSSQVLFYIQNHSKHVLHYHLAYLHTAIKTVLKVVRGVRNLCKKNKNISKGWWWRISQFPILCAAEFELFQPVFSHIFSHIYPNFWKEEEIGQHCRDILLENGMTLNSQ